MWLALLQGLSFATVPLLSFGPFKIFVFSSALRQGWRRSLPLALTPLIADVPVILLIWFILQQVPDWAVNALRMLGGLFYVYLAVGLLRNIQRSMNADALEDAPRRSFRQALTAIWFSPKIYLDWSVIGVPALLGYADQSPWHAVGFLLGFYVLWVGGLGLQIVLFGQAGKLPARTTAVIIVIASLLLVAFGAYQFYVGATALLGP